MNNQDFFRPFSAAGKSGRILSLKALQESGAAPNLDRLPISIRIVLESVARCADGVKVSMEDVRKLGAWSAKKAPDFEAPFTVARIVLQDFTGVPALVDLAAMREAAARRGGDPRKVEPLAPVDLVVDHSVQVDFAGTQAALSRNLDIEFIRNRERYEFLKWGQQAFGSFSVVPPGVGIVHQVNLEYLAKGVMEKDGVFFPDSLVGTDSHTTMINGLGVVGWGVGGIEAEAGMLGQPITFLAPEVVGVNLIGKLPEGATATDLVLRITEMLRAHGVVGKFVEFYGPGARALSAPDRATIANMAPEYGATMGFFPVDEETLRYYRGTGRSEEQCQLIEAYFREQGMFGVPDAADIDCSESLELDIASIKPSVSGPKRPQDRIDVDDLREKFNELFTAPINDGGFGRAPEDRGKCVPLRLETPAGDFAPIPETSHPAPGAPKNEAEMEQNRPTADHVPSSEAFKRFEPVETELRHGSALIAAITSCTNTSNPSVMLAAGLLAKKANERGLRPPPYVKTSLAPGSRVVSDYLQKTDLQKELDVLGFQTVGYGCTTCIGNSGPLHPAIEDAISEGELVCASVLSGNRNFEARVHGSIRANFLMSPPLVVAYAIAGRVDIDLSTEPLGQDQNGEPVRLRDIWPSQEEVRAHLQTALNPEVFRALYQAFESQNPKWNEIPAKTGSLYPWDENSTYIQNPPFFADDAEAKRTAADIEGARALGIFGDSVTTDHISPAGAIKEDGPAGRYLLDQGVKKDEFNSFGSRRGNDRVMTRGTFANVRIKNLMVSPKEGGLTLHYPAAGGAPQEAYIFDAAQKYKEENRPLVIITGEDYGMGSSRDWAAKGTLLLGVKAVVAKSFERIHRSNLIGMGVLPLCFQNPADYDDLIANDETRLGAASFSIHGLAGGLRPGMGAELSVSLDSAPEKTVKKPLLCRLDTPAEVDYYLSGGILQFVLEQILTEQ